MQTDSLCMQKREKKRCSWFLYVHAVVISLISWFALGYFKFWYLALIIGVSHLLLDMLKVYAGEEDVWLFVLDQVAHILILAISAFVCIDKLGWTTPIWLCGRVLKVEAILVAVIVCWKPANLFVKDTLKYNSVSFPDESTQSFHAGKLIGTIERWLILVFILIGRYDVIGFLIAAKSIIRFGEGNKGTEIKSNGGGETVRDADKDKTEYFLAGTLLSIAIAVGCGLAVRLII